jgi:putative iron-only hydrogenase system regulator
MHKRLGFVGIIVENRQAAAAEVNRVLSEFGGLICARMGLPYPKRDCSVITLIVDATTDELGSLTGRLGMIQSVSVKSALGKLAPAPAPPPPIHE